MALASTGPIAVRSAAGIVPIPRILSGKLPEEFENDLRKIVEVITVPMSVRSSSLLEDSHYQPFAGVYQTCMIPNKGTDDCGQDSVGIYILQGGA